MRGILCGMILAAAMVGCTGKPVMPEKPVSDPLFTSKLNLSESPPPAKEGGK